jgi:hypothetical protein
MNEERHQDFQLSDLEAWILETVDNIGWYAYLWFPVIQREVLNFGAIDTPDEEVYAAFSGLVRKAALVQSPSVKWEGTGGPEWRPDRRALVIAQEILRSKFGWPEAYKPPSKAP